MVTHNKSNKILSLLLTVLMLFSTFSFSLTALAQGNNQNNAITLPYQTRTDFNYVYNAYGALEMTQWYKYTATTDGIHNITYSHNGQSMRGTVQLIVNNAVIASKEIPTSSNGVVMTHKLTKGQLYYIKCTAKPFMTIGVQNGTTTRFSITINGHTHIWEESDVFGAGDNTRVKRCVVCGETQQVSVPAKAVFEDKDRFVYDGKAHAPKFTPKDTVGNEISSTYYYARIYGPSATSNVKPSTVTACGKYKAVVRFRNGYVSNKANNAPYEKVYYIIPPKTVINTKKSTAAKTSITLKWSKVSKAKGYHIEYATNKNFTGAKKITVKKNSTVSKKITKLKKNKTYYFRIKAYTTCTYLGKKNVEVTSYYSKTASIKTKK